MASSEARTALQRSPTYAVVPIHLQQAWINYVLTLGDATRRPEDGEEFPGGPEECKRRLNTWGFTQGCAYVIIRSRATDFTPSWQFSCFFHGNKSKNWRNIQEDRVEKDQEGQITSQRQRNTSNRKFGCPSRYSLVYTKRQGGEDRWYRGRWINSQHKGHDIPINPYYLDPLRSLLPEHDDIKATATIYRLASQPYSQAIKLLRAEYPFGLQLPQRDYYNLIRRRPLPRSDSRSSIALLTALDEAGFRYHCRTEEEWQQDKADKACFIGQKLLQIVFWYGDGIHQLQRFLVGHLLVVDATFNTNDARLPLMTSLAFDNEHQRIPVAFSYVAGETKEAYSYFLEVINTDILNNGDARPAVVLGDQATGLTAALNTFLPGQKLQNCNWHAHSAMITRFRKAGSYTSEEIELLQGLTWDYIQSPTREALDYNRQALYRHLLPGERAYLQEWQAKEDRIITYHTRRLSNLGCNATQSLESFHAVIHQVTNGQMSLQQSAGALAQRIQQEFRTLTVSEDQGRLKQPTGLNIARFSGIRGQISLFALRKIESEWLALE